MKVILPFRFNSTPLKKLALFNFEKNPEVIYVGLELQYIEGEPHGIGWRVIAYRKDKFVDVYDSEGLNTIENETFDVAGKGLANYRKVSMDNTYFFKDDLGVHMGFKFKDLLDRNIEVKVDENSKKKTKGINLLAPIGSGTEKPVLLPLFFLYKFDFVRKNKTNISIIIDDKNIKPDNFPAPILKDCQKIYFSRYSMDSQIVEFGKASNEILEIVDLENNNSIVKGDNTYIFKDNNIESGLEAILLSNEKHPMKITFTKPIPIIIENEKDADGEFIIQTDTEMGMIKGIYDYKIKNAKIYITLIPNEGWKAIPNSLLTKMLFNVKGIFAHGQEVINILRRYPCLIILQNRHGRELIVNKNKTLEEL